MPDKAVNPVCHRSGELPGVAGDRDRGRTGAGEPRIDCCGERITAAAHPARSRAVDRRRADSSGNASVKLPRPHASFVQYQRRLNHTTRIRRPA